MPEEAVRASQITVKIGGSPLSPEMLNRLIETVVDQSTNLPHMFMLRLHDDDVKFTDGRQFDIGKAVEIQAEKEDNSSVTLFKGEITAVEPQFREGMDVELVVRGYDKSHRLYREVRSKSYMNVKDSDIASQIAGNCGLSAQVDSTTAVYDHVFQHNQTDMAFLTQRAWRIGYECFADEGKLYFRKPPTSGTTATLNWGEDLISFMPVMSTAEQVDEVMVKGWDVTKKEAIVGKAKKGTLYASSTAGGEYTKAGTFGTGKKIIVDLPVVSQAEANTLAQARLNEISGAHIQATGTAFRRPDIKAGQFVELTKLGKRFSGKYFVTGARHIYSADGLHTYFEVRGLRTGLLSEQMLHSEPLDRWPGAVVGVVTDTNDPEAYGRVKVKYPWMTDDAESFWARVISPGAGPEAGLFMVPDVGDEVMVIFEHGDFDRPYVLGGVWNGKDKIPPPGAGAKAGEKPLVRTWHSRTGHHISVYDDAENKIEIITAGGHKLVMSDKDKKIHLVTSKNQELLVDDNANNVKVKTAGTVNIESTGAMTMKSTGNLTIEGSMIDVKASGPLNLKGAVVNIN